ncbi:MAG: addiction module protein [Verrucomicrobia bacterium]|nr:addiction module protein [Verrucomicrobiota bacterium]
MSKTLEKVTREAIDLSSHQRLALARFLIELEDTSEDPDVQIAWEIEIRDRVRAVEEGRVKGIPYDQVLARVDRRLAR